MDLCKVRDLASSEAFAIPSSCKAMEYGTAGFRTIGTNMRHVAFRMGVLCAIRSKILCGKGVGLVITASHNPIADNGVKVVDPDGQMLAAEWEVLATQMANSATAVDVAQKIIAENMKNANESVRGVVFIGRDTRPSSDDLFAAAFQAASAIPNCTVIDCGIVTTPQLHYFVRVYNEGATSGENLSSDLIQVQMLPRYFKEMCSAFREYLSLCAIAGSPRRLIVDCANGVGALALIEACNYLSGVLDLEAINDGTTGGELNAGCGADFVKVTQKAPVGVAQMADVERFASFDGDADRLVCFYGHSGIFHLLDGDKIAILLAGHIGKLLSESGLSDKLKVGLVQTAYANGASTSFIRDKLKVPVVCVPTGVKHLHKAAHDLFDIGIYFEANGHGTVIFNQKACDILVKNSSSMPAKKLNCLRRIINPAVGDALSDLLAVEAVLADLGWSFADWDACYTDLPSRQLKVSVSDRSVITTEDAERRCCTPVGLQAAIDSVVAKLQNGRAFARPSGTEDVVRIYAEASTQSETDWLAYDVASLVYKMAGGVKAEPIAPKEPRLSSN